MEKRVSQRIVSRVRVMFGPGGPECLGFALNLSSGGIFLSSTKLFPPSTALRIRLEPIGAPTIGVSGHVRWGLQVPQQLITVVKPGMGIQLESPPREYLDFFARLVKLNPARTSQRVDAHLEVHFYHREQFIKEYTENISRGGLYIATGKVIEPGTEIKVDLVIPDLANVWQVAGRVAYRLNAEEARRLDTEPGIGIDISRTDPRVLEALQAYVQRILRLYR